jgi:glycosyltransferase involved in cell wall biosynthesis
MQRGLASEVVITSWDYDPSLVTKLRRVLQQQQVDLIHTYGAKAELATLLATFGLGIPLIGSYFGCFPMWPLHVQIAEATSLLNLRFFNQVLANSATLKDELVRLWFPVGRIQVVPSYVETDQIQPPSQAQRRAARETLGLSPTAPVLIQLARLHKEKGHKYMLQALPAIVQAHPEVIYLIVGEGWLADELREMAQRLGVAANVIFTGYYPDRLEVLRAADIMVSPSIREGMSVSLLEGMAMGLPIVATRIYGSAEVIHDGANGFLVEPRNAVALADAVNQFLQDGPRSQEMGAAARSLVEAHFSADHIAAQILCCYNGVLERGAAVGPVYSQDSRKTIES